MKKIVLGIAGVAVIGVVCYFFSGSFARESTQLGDNTGEKRTYFEYGLCNRNG